MEPQKEFYTAFLKAQAKIQGAHKDSQNPHFRSKYADLESIMDAVKEPLNGAGIIILQPIVGEVVETRLIHAESGQTVVSAMPIVCKDPSDPQKWGSAITYARRYTLQSLCALPAVDDDGNAASTKPKEKPAPIPQTQPTEMERFTKFCQDQESRVGKPIWESYLASWEVNSILEINHEHRKEFAENAKKLKERAQ